MSRNILSIALITAIALIAAACLTAPAHANEASVKSAMEAKLGVKISSIKKTPYLGLYEIYADGQIFYTDAKQSVIIAGALIDGKTMQNYTAERMQKN